MDLADLAPALLGLSQIVKLANSQINGDRASVKVLASLDTEHQCFEFSVEIVQAILERGELLVDADPIATAAEIGKAVGIIGGLETAVGLFKAHKWLAKQAKRLSELGISEEGDKISIRDVNHSSIVINKNTYNLLVDPRAARNVQDVVRPLTNDGYEKLQFEEDGEITEEISSDEGRDICAASPESLEVQHLINKSRYEAKVKVKRPDYLSDSQWSVVHDRAIMAKVEDDDWLERFHKAEINLPPGSFLHVKMRMEIMLDSNSNPIDEPKYFIEEVLAVIPPEQQGDLFAQ